MMVAINEVVSNMLFGLAKRQFELGDERKCREGLAMALELNHSGAACQRDVAYRWSNLDDFNLAK